MKRLLALALTLFLLLSLGTLYASAVEFDAWSEVTLEVLYEQADVEVYSPLAEDYSAWWWDEEVPEIDNYATAATIQMRGFALSHDGRYAYMGTLNGGSGVRGAVVFDMLTGQVTDLYYHYDGDAGLPGSPFSYAKGIAADDRGYVYVGFAFSQNYNVVNLGIAEQKDDGKLEEVSFDAVYAFGDPGDSGGIKVGVNGVDVAKVGDKYYCYVMTNYNHDALYCLDVTDPANPKLNNDFGTNGMINFNEDNCPVKSGDFVLDEGQYMDVDDNGVIWLVADAKNGSKGVMQITPDGTACAEVAIVENAYSVAHFNNYLLVGMKNGSAVKVIDDASFEEVATLTMPDGYNERVAYVTVVKDVLFATNSATSQPNAIVYYPLSSDGQDFINEIAASLNAIEEETEAPTEATDETEAPVDETEAPVDETEAPTEAATKAVEETDASAPAGDGGCASVISVASALTLLLSAAAVAFIKKKAD